MKIEGGVVERGMGSTGVGWGHKRVTRGVYDLNTIYIKIEMHIYENVIMKPH